MMRRRARGFLDRHSPLRHCPMEGDPGARKVATWHRATPATFLHKRERNSAESIHRPAVAGHAFLTKYDHRASLFASIARTKKVRRMLQISERMSEPTLDSMNFLNEVVGRYPRAISFAPGRPSPELFGVEKSLDLLRKHAPAILGRPDIRSEQALNEIAQYGRTNGIVHRHIARQLLQDEGLDLDPDQLVITNGCQEAMLLLLLTLFTPPRDVLLATEPVYLGITAAARLLGIEVVAIRLRPDGPDLEQLAEVVQLLRQQGKVPRALYTIPDFDNPSGYTTSLATREQLCVLARRHNLLLLEDTPYRMLRFESEPLPLLKAIAPEQVVLLGSYSKTIFPGLRLGFLSGDVEVSLAGRALPLAQIVAKAKSLTSVNTSPLMQATLASLLIENGHSLASHTAMISAH